MTKKYEILLTNDELGVLEGHMRSVSYDTDFSVHYEGQVPYVGHVLYKGIGHKSKGKKKIGMKEGEVFGIRELLENIPCDRGLIIEKGTQLLAIDKTSLLDILSGRDKKVISIFQRIINF